VSLLCTCPFSLCGVLFSGNPRRLLPHCRVRSWTHCLRPRSSSEFRDRQRWSRRSITSFVARQRTSHLWERRKSFQFVSHFTCRSCALAHSHSVVFCFRKPSPTAPNPTTAKFSWNDPSTLQSPFADSMSTRSMENVDLPSQISATISSSRKRRNEHLGDDGPSMKSLCCRRNE
jgi:hypothetical protein